LDDRAFELGKDAEHLKHSLAAPMASIERTPFDKPNFKRRPNFKTSRREGSMRRDGRCSFVAFAASAT